MLSIVVPCYNEEESIPLFYKEIIKHKEDISEKIELLFIDDGSSDRSLERMRELYQESPEEIRYISLSRNFGKEAALLAGLEASRGEFVTVMDVDLQDPPSLLSEMLDIVKSSEYDCVATCRVSREGEPLIRSYFARKFYKMINRISDVEIVEGARDYRVMTRKMVDSILDMKEVNRFSKGMFSWVGFKVKFIEYKNIERVAGETTWSFWNLIKYAIDGIVDFSEAPLNFATYIGITTFIMSIFSLFYVVIRALLFGDSTSGWPSIVSIMLFVGGIQLLCLGIIGKYLGKIYIECKNRPIYIIKEDEKNKIK